MNDYILHLQIMEQLNDACEIGKLMSDDSCHKTWYTKEKEYMQVCELFNADILKLFWRAGCKSCLDDGSLTIRNNATVWFYHNCVYLTCFEKKQILMFMQHQEKKQKCGSHSVTLQTAQQLEEKFCLLSGEKLFRECWIYTTDTLSSHHSPSFLSVSEDTKESSESSSAENHSTLLNDSLAALAVSPFKSTGKSKRQKL